MATPQLMIQPDPNVVAQLNALPDDRWHTIADPVLASDRALAMFDQAESHGKMLGLAGGVVVGVASALIVEVMKAAIRRR